MSDEKEERGQAVPRQAPTVAAGEDQVDKERASALLEHAWRYFELHAGQRMSLFNFFLALSGLAAAGIAAALTADAPLPGVAGALGALLSLTALVFGKLDQRVCFLMREAELVGARAEGLLFNPEDCLFAREPERTSQSQKTGTVFSNVWTYGKSFRLVFSTVGLLGILVAAYSFTRV